MSETTPDRKGQLSDVNNRFDAAHREVNEQNSDVKFKASDSNIHQCLEKEETKEYLQSSEQRDITRL